MTFVEALQRSWSEGMGCRMVGDATGTVHYLRRDGAGQFVVRAASPATRRKIAFDEPGAPALLSALMARYEVCELPHHVDPDFRPAKARTAAPNDITDLL